MYPSVMLSSGILGTPKSKYDMPPLFAFEYFLFTIEIISKWLQVLGLYPSVPVIKPL